jgi:predicted enzyme related to lactoylglutathione lyase
MVKLASEKLGIQGLGWIVRRTAQAPAALTPFYQAALGLRQLRPAGPTGTVMLWAGDIVMFELGVLALGADTHARRDDFSFLMRARDFEGAKKALLAAGAKTEREDVDSTRTLLVRDPAGMAFGLWEAATTSSFPPDARADALWRNGVVTLPNTQGLPNKLQDIASINLKVADPVAMAAFYHDLFAFDLLGAPSAAGATLALGRTAALELHPGGTTHQALTNRDQSPDTWILRVYDHAGLTERLKRKNVTIINELSITGGKLTYALDPEGRVFGLQQRTPDLLPAGATERVEDVVARTLWARLSD